MANVDFRGKHECSTCVPYPRKKTWDLETWDLETWDLRASALAGRHPKAGLGQRKVAAVRHHDLRLAPDRWPPGCGHRPQLHFVPEASYRVRDDTHVVTSRFLPDLGPFAYADGSFLRLTIECERACRHHGRIDRDRGAGSPSGRPARVSPSCRSESKSCRNK